MLFRKRARIKLSILILATGLTFSYDIYTIILLAEH